MPKGNSRLYLRNKIHNISENYGGPKFEPHVTLLSGFLGKEEDLLDKLKILSVKIKPFDIILSSINYLDEFFRSFFLEVKITNELLSARSLATKEFSIIKKVFFPHMSLAYGNYSLSTKLLMKSEIDKIPNNFLCNEIFLVRNNEIDLQWEIINSYKLIN